MREEEFQQQIIDLAHLYGWLVYHTRDSRRSTPGFPDLVLVRDRVLFREVKMAGGRLSDAQLDWKRRLESAGADFGVWWPDGAAWDRVVKELR